MRSPEGLMPSFESLTYRFKGGAEHPMEGLTDAQHASTRSSTRLSGNRSPTRRMLDPESRVTAPRGATESRA